MFRPRLGSQLHSFVLSGILIFCQIIISVAVQCLHEVGTVRREVEVKLVQKLVFLRDSALR